MTLTNDECIKRFWTQIDFVDTCTNCGTIGSGYYRNNDTLGDARPESMCRPCVIAGLEHGRLHVPEAFEEDEN